MVTSLDVKLLAEVCQKPWNDAYRYGLCFIQKLSFKSQINSSVLQKLEAFQCWYLFLSSWLTQFAECISQWQKPCQIFLSPAWAWPGTRPGLDQNLCASKTASPLKSPEASKFPWDQQDQPPFVRMKMDDAEPLLAHIGDENCDVKLWKRKQNHESLGYRSTSFGNAPIQETVIHGGIAKGFPLDVWNLKNSKNSVFIGFTKTKLSALAHTYSWFKQKDLR